MNANPRRRHINRSHKNGNGRQVNNARRVADMLEAKSKGKGFQIVVKGQCRVCRKRSAAVPASGPQVMAWVTSQDTTGFTKAEVRMLETGVHSQCQLIQDAKAAQQQRPEAVVKAEAKAKAPKVTPPVDLDVALVIARKRAQRDAKNNPAA